MPSRDQLRAWSIPAAIVFVGTLPWFYAYVLSPDIHHWMVDLRVYREAGVSLLQGRPVYDHHTPPPQNLPFTYPPFAALLAIPLALLPFKLLGVVWFYGQLIATIMLVRIAGAPLLRPGTAGAQRLGRWREVVWGLGALAIASTLPAADGLKFGQVNAFLVVAVLIDLTRRDLDRRMRVPQGVFVGIATAIKLTPGVFIVYYLVTRQWRAALTSIATAGGVTIAAFAVAPKLSMAFWFDALLAPDRLGHNDGTANQSLRGALMRLLPESPGLQKAIWLGLVAAVVVVGYAAAKRAYDRAELVLAFTIVGCVSVLVSPVSWSHHFHWLLPGVVWLVAVGVMRHSRGMVLAGAALWLTLTLHLTWWAHWQLMAPSQDAVFDPQRSTGDPFWSVLHNAYALAAICTLFGLSAMARRLPDLGLGWPRPVANPLQATARREAQADP